jgi:hypothetical protein
MHGVESMIVSPLSPKIPKDTRRMRTCRHPDHFLRRTLDNHPAAAVAPFRPQVDHPVGLGDDVEVVRFLPNSISLTGDALIFSSALKVNIPCGDIINILGEAPKGASL